MKKLVLVTTAPFQGLPELVADQEGLFAEQGLDVQWAEPDSDGKRTAVNVSSLKDINPFSRHGIMLEQGRAGMYSACEWDNRCRVQETQVDNRQVGRRAMATYAALMVRPDSQIYIPQELAARTVGVPFYVSTHYFALQLLEGFVPREQINLCRAPDDSRQRLDALMRGEIEVTTLTEPYITLAEKKGCRLICGGFYHETEVALNRVDVETYAAFNCAVREAVKRINADKAKYLCYFIDYHTAKDPEICKLRPEDLPASHVAVCDPAPIPPDEIQRTYDWLKSWGLLEHTCKSRSSERPHISRK